MRSAIRVKQLPIDEAAQRKLIEARLGMFYDDMSAIAEQIFNGELLLAEWEYQMRQYIRGMHSSMGAIGKGGWDNMTQSDWGRIGAWIKKQYKYLHGFAEDIAANRDTIALGTVQARANMYGEAAGLTAMMMSTNGIIISKLPWMPKDGSTECLVNCKCIWVLEVIKRTKRYQTVYAVWRLRPAEHCNDCLDRANYKLTFNIPANIPVPNYIGGY